MFNKTMGRLRQSRSFDDSPFITFLIISINALFVGFLIGIGWGFLLLISWTKKGGHYWLVAGVFIVSWGLLILVSLTMNERWEKDRVKKEQKENEK